MDDSKRPYAVIAIVVAAVLGVLVFAGLMTRGPDTAGLTGRTWQLTAITGETPAFQGVIPAEDQWRYTIAFSADGTFAARADCNQVAGSYELSGDDGMTITSGPSTLVACPDGSYGSLYVNALASVTTWALDGAQLILTTADGGTGTFVEGSGAVPTPTPSPSPSPSPTPSPSPSPTPSPTPSPSPTPTPSPTPEPSGTSEPSSEPTATAAPTAEPTPAPTASPAPTPQPTPAPTATPEPGAGLVGTAWQLAAISTREPVSEGEIPADQRSKYTIAFAAGGMFSATADCNTVTGQWSATAEGGLTLTPGPSTIIACPEGSYGDLYVLALTNSASYVQAEATLTITLRDGGTLTFEPVP